MKVFYQRYDGGVNSGVTGYWLIECKALFSIVLLKFEPNHRENYHNHAFNAITWWLKGEAIESFPDAESIIWTPSIMPKITYKNNMHKYKVTKPSYALTFRGRWDKEWDEFDPISQQLITLTNKRVVVKKEKYEFTKSK